LTVKVSHLGSKKTHFFLGAGGEGWGEKYSKCGVGGGHFEKSGGNQKEGVRLMPKTKRGKVWSISRGEYPKNTKRQKKVEKKGGEHTRAEIGSILKAGKKWNESKTQQKREV